MVDAMQEEMKTTCQHDSGVSSNDMSHVHHALHKTTTSTYLTMFIRSRQKIYFSSTEPHESCNHITCRRRIGMTYMWLVVNVVNGCGNLKGAIVVGWMVV